MSSVCSRGLSANGRTGYGQLLLLNNKLLLFPMLRCFYYTVYLFVCMGLYTQILNLYQITAWGDKILNSLTSHMYWLL